jgi:hypothetical protein
MDDDEYLAKVRVAGPIPSSAPVNAKTTLSRLPMLASFHVSMTHGFVRPGFGQLHVEPAEAGWRAVPICLWSALRVAT